MAGIELEHHSKTIRNKDPIFNSGMVDDGDLDNEPPKTGLDSEENEQIHTALMNHYRTELNRQYQNRLDQAIDEDYYDNIQFTEEEERELIDRGQAPLVYNVISQTINWIIGSEKRGRTDFKILPREEEDLKPAEQKTKLLKYLSDVNKSPFNRSRAFEDGVKVGIGWMEDGAQERDGNEGEIVYDKYVDWREMLWDSLGSNEMDMSDSRWISRTKWVDADDLHVYFPDRRYIIEQSTITGQYGMDALDIDGDEAMDSQENAYYESEGYYDTADTGSSFRPRVRVIEMWFTKPVRKMKIIDGPVEYVGQVFDKENPNHKRLVMSGVAITGERVVKEMQVALMTVKGLLYIGPTPYKHNKFPYTPIWCYRRGRDKLPYGVIRGLRDMQDNINKRAAKALYIISSNKVIMEEGAVDDLEEMREEVSDPAGVIVVNPGRRFEIDADRGLDQSHIDAMARDISMVQQVSGVTDELKGYETNAQSGIAVQKRQQQGMMSTAKIFDNLRYAVQIQGEKRLSLVEQFFTDKRVIRITNERNTAQFESINDGTAENDITKRSADFIIGEDDWRASMRQAATEQLMDMISRLPAETSLTLLDLVVDMMDVPNREEIVKRLRALNGQRDPDATEMTPEEKLKAIQNAKQQKIQEEMIASELREKNAKAEKAEAEAKKATASSIQTRVETQDTAVDTAIKTLQHPDTVRVADKLLKSGGFLSPEEMDAVRQHQQAQAAAMQAQPQGQPQNPQQQPQPM